MNQKVRPVQFVWDGDTMVPQPRFLPICNKQFVVHEVYTMMPLEERSMKSHSHFFAALHDGWLNIPESMAARWPTEEHLRKWCLIECNFFTEKEFEFPTEDLAQNFAAFFRTVDDFCRIYPVGSRVIIRHAMSQSMALMGKEQFQKSKTAVLDLVESICSVPNGSLMKRAKESA